MSAPLPDWFLGLFDEAVRRLGWTLRGWKDGSALVTDAKGKESTMGLDNIHRRLAGMDEGQRLETLLGHLKSVNRADAPDDLNAVRERLMVRIREAFADDEIGRSVWAHPLGETGLVAVLVIDFPDAMTYVRYDMVEESGRDGAYWLAFALENLRTMTEPGMVQELDSGAFGVGTGDAYDAARALVLEKLWPGDAPHGFLVSVATRDVLLFYPVDAELLDRRFADLVIRSMEWFDKEPYPITDRLFWVRGLEWEEVGYEYENEELTATLPAGLSSLLG